MRRSGTRDIAGTSGVTVRAIAVGVGVAVATLVLAGCTGGAKFPRNDDGGFEGTVTWVGQDNLRMDVGDGNMWVDTWAVCGDNTSRNVSVGDEIVVFADREPFSYDAWRILDADGEPACAD